MWLLRLLGAAILWPPSTHAAMERRQRILVSPRWKVFAGLEDSKGTMSGTMLILLLGPNTIGVDTIRSFIDVSNFMGGNDGRIDGGQLVDKHAVSFSIRFVGNFKQNFDDTCFPFETKVAKFDIGFVRPGEQRYKFGLFCEGDSTPAAEQNNVTKCTKAIGASALNIDWDTWACSLDLEGESLVTCQLSGKRSPHAIAKAYIIPGLFFMIIGCSSFALPIKYAMPRVAASTIAMLTLSNYRMQILKILPKAEEGQVLEEFYNWTTYTMFATVMFHILSLGLDARGWHHFQFVDECLLSITPLGFLLYMFVLVYIKGCYDFISSEAAVLVIVLLSLSIIVALICLVRRHRIRSFLICKDSTHKGHKATPIDTSTTEAAAIVGSTSTAEAEADV